MSAIRSEVCYQQLVRRLRDERGSLRAACHLAPRGANRALDAFDQAARALLASQPIHEAVEFCVGLLALASVILLPVLWFSAF